MNRRYKSIILSLIVMLFASYSIYGSEAKTISRNYQSIVIEGAYFELFISNNTPLDSLYVYSFNASTNEWHPIPYQIDERYRAYFENDTISSYFPIGDDEVEKDYTLIDSANGLLDSIDELALLYKDLGDSARSEYWIDDPSSKTFKRYQITITDTLHGIPKKGWFYVYRSNNAITRNNTKYIQYDPIADRVNTNYYEVGFDNFGTLSDFIIKENGGGNGNDILDRNKFRYSGKLFGLPFDWSDTTLIKDTVDYKHSIEYKTGPVRLIRLLHSRLVLAGIDDDTSFPVPFQNIFSPYIYAFSKNIPVPVQLKTELVRFSYDYNEEAINMNFFSNDSLGENINSNIIMDGSGKTDGTIDSLTTNKPFWTMVKGTPGTILTLNNVIYTGEGDYRMRLYYWDSSDNDNKDGAALSSGDDISIGDNGIYFSSYNLNNNIISKNNIYFLRSAFPVDSVQNLFDEFNNPPQIFRELQLFTPTPVLETSLKNIPKKFKLYETYPNPFNASTTISFDLPIREKVSIKIFNIQGRYVTTLTDNIAAAGHHEIVWNGTNNSGNTAGSGVYIVQIKTKQNNATVKTVLLK